MVTCIPIRKQCIHPGSSQILFLLVAGMVFCTVSEHLAHAGAKEKITFGILMANDPAKIL
ncbi:hypothetical protein [uncultured Desulfobacter sp.]|uniref:hypothetical protein n=1 Tax=uncultured Desulfobacter sp. TaxID=240139 RepID=UPI002AAB5B8E|nr:hypothetical protein [uncultured Desulfobacter sp.]